MSEELVRGKGETLIARGRKGPGKGGRGQALFSGKGKKSPTRENHQA